MEDTLIDFSDLQGGGMQAKPQQDAIINFDTQGKSASEGLIDFSDLLKPEPLTMEQKREKVLQQYPQLAPTPARSVASYIIPELGKEQAEYIKSVIKPGTDAQKAQIKGGYKNILKPVTQEPSIGMPEPETFADKVRRVIRGKPEERLGKSQVAYNISQITNIPVTEVEKNLPAISKQLGIRGEPTNNELISALIQIGIAGKIGASPAAIPKVAAGIAGFMGLGELENFVISKVKKEPYKALQGKGLKELLPDEASEISQDITEIADFALKAAVLGYGYKKAPQIAEKLTKNVVEKYNLPKEVYISPSAVKAATGQGIYDPKAPKATSQELEIIKSLNLSTEQWGQAIRQGVSIKVPASKIVTLSDKPYWAKIKGAFNIKPYKAELAPEYAGGIAQQTVLQKPVAGLPEGITGRITPEAPVPITPTPAIALIAEKGQIAPTLPPEQEAGKGIIPPTKKEQVKLTPEQKLTRQFERDMGRESIRPLLRMTDLASVEKFIPLSELKQYGLYPIDFAARGKGTPIDKVAQQAYALSGEGEAGILPKPSERENPDEALFQTFLEYGKDRQKAITYAQQEIQAQYEQDLYELKQPLKEGYGDEQGDKLASGIQKQVEKEIANIASDERRKETITGITPDEIRQAAGELSPDDISLVKEAISNNQTVPELHRLAVEYLDRAIEKPIVKPPAESAMAAESKAVLTVGDEVTVKGMEKPVKIENIRTETDLTGKQYKEYFTKEGWIPADKIISKLSPKTEAEALFETEEVTTEKKPAIPKKEMTAEQARKDMEAQRQAEREVQRLPDEGEMFTEQKSIKEYYAGEGGGGRIVSGEPEGGKPFIPGKEEKIKFPATGGRNIGGVYQKQIGPELITKHLKVYSGLFKYPPTPNGKVAARSVSNLKTIAHETGHFLDLLLAKYPIARSGPVREELIALTKIMRPFEERYIYGVSEKTGLPTKRQDSYTSYRRSRQELFADYVAGYANTPDIAKETAPQFTAIIEEQINAGTETGKAIEYIIEKLRQFNEEFNPLIEYVGSLRKIPEFRKEIEQYFERGNALSMWYRHNIGDKLWGLLSGKLDKIGQAKFIKGFFEKGGVSDPVFFATKERLRLMHGQAAKLKEELIEPMTALTPEDKFFVSQSLQNFEINEEDTPIKKLTEQARRELALWGNEARKLGL
ncbi:MAG: hypothetical protein PHF74_05545 [Dehalococcoidales bacterium]|nr:hypothetical protein [Dehalococcoidales bacterium]